MIHVMAVTGLGGTAMSAPVVGYDAIAMLEEEHHLRVPIVGRQRPAVAKHDGLTFAPVLVIDLRSVFRRDCCHRSFSFSRECIPINTKSRGQAVRNCGNFFAAAMVNTTKRIKTTSSVTLNGCSVFVGARAFSAGTLPKTCAIRTKTFR